MKPYFGNPASAYRPQPTTYQTALEAIRHSADHDEIAWCEDTPDNRERLMIECDDNIEANEVAEYWADDPFDSDDMEWRVHVQLSE